MKDATIISKTRSLFRHAKIFLGEKNLFLSGCQLARIH
jgi:hypothetical protein